MSPQQEALAGLNRLREAIRAGRKDVQMLVPTATLAQHRRHQLAREGLVFRPDSIQTLSRLAAQLAPETRQVSEPLFHLVIERALQNGEEQVFAVVSDAPGFPASIARTIRRLDAAGLTPGDLQRICGEWPYAAPLTRIWQRAQTQLRSMGMTLRSGVLRAAARMAEASGLMLLDGFQKFSGPERELLRALGAEPEVTPVFENDLRTERFAADSEIREAEEIARRILKSGVAFREIGIALRNPSHGVAVLRPVLERFGIPARFYFSEPLARSPAVRLMAGTVEAFLSGWEHELCLAVLRLCEPDDAKDFAVREQIPNSGLAALQQTYPAKAVRHWETLGRTWQRALPPQTWAAQLSADLKTAYPPQRVNDSEEWAKQAWQRSQATAVSLFEAALVEAAALWSGEARPIPLAEFWAAAKSLIEHTALRTEDARRNVVHVMSVYEARQWTLDTVFVFGLAEKTFPKRHPQDAFLPDPAVEKLKRAGFALDTSADLDQEESVLFRMVCAGARSMLVLSYAMDGKNGPSPFWVSPESTTASPTLVRPALPLRLKARRPVRSITDEGLLDWMIKRRTAYSVTGLENYLGCPFKFFSLQMLSLKGAPKRPERRLDPLAEGTIVHQVLEKWVKEQSAIRPVLDQEFDQHCAARRVTRGYRTEAAYARMLADLERFADSHPGWLRTEAEGREKKVEFEIGPGITVSARVDRVEKLPDGTVVIVDYKYSNAANTKGKVDDETRLQGPLYVRAMETGGERVSAMVYFSLKRSAEAFGWGVVPGLGKQLEPLRPDWVAAGVQEAQRAVAEIRGGRIAVEPVSDAPCKYCEAKDSCRNESKAALAASFG